MKGARPWTMDVEDGPEEGDKVRPVRKKRFPASSQCHFERSTTELVAQQLHDFRPDIDWGEVGFEKANEFPSSRMEQAQAT